MGKVGILIVANFRDSRIPAIVSFPLNIPFCVSLWFGQQFGNLIGKNGVVFTGIAQELENEISRDLRYPFKVG